ncbi:MAG: SHOCT domain-containing protein, partial [Methanomassiliicoccales archaeon]|nr:SHOCT domain-containing protein [Methanomassiliicoccales archaeon]
RNGYVLLSLIKKKVGIKGTGLDAIVMPMALGQMALNRDPKAVEGVITDQAAVVKVHDCIFKGASPEFCVTISHYTADLVCEAINPDYECVWTHHLNQGDPYCRYIYKKKQDNLDFANPGKTISVLNFPPMPEEDRLDIRNFVLTHFWDATTEAFMDLRGSKVTLDHLLPVAYQIGQEMGEAFRKVDTTPTITTAMIGGMFDMLGQMMHQRGRTSRVSHDEFRKDISECAFQTFPNEMCRQMEALLQGITKSVNPDVEFSYGCMMNDGAPKCSWSVRKKGTMPSPNNYVEEAVSQSQDNLSILKSRLASGEISLDEFEKIRKVIFET